jgi:SagB-type dehydrogenase family enzyme
MKQLVLTSIMLCSIFFTDAQDINLPSAQTKGGKAFFETVNQRQSKRSYVKKEMPLQMLSNLLWTANGFNRQDKRTAPTAMNRQEMELYVMLDNGVYFYDAKNNSLKLVEKGDFRAALGQSAISENAAVNVIMVADLNKSSKENAGLSTGYISQNIYLFAASEDLGTVARGSFKADELAKALKLTEKQAVILVQPVGFL